MKKTIFTLITAALIYSPSAYCQESKQSDKWTEGRIQGILDFNKYYNSSDIDVSYNAGVLSLSGEVTSNEEKEFAEKVSKKISGCTKINNYIRVNNNLVPRSRTDLEEFISDAAADARVSTMIRALKIYNNTIIDVKTAAGLVILTGSVPDLDTGLIAEKVAFSAEGVKKVSNQLKIEDPGLIEDKIRQLSRNTSEIYSDAWISAQARFFISSSTEMSGSDLTVVTRNGEVHLKGHLKSSSQSKYLSEMLILIAGVLNVHNNSTVRN